MLMERRKVGFGKVFWVNGEMVGMGRMLLLTAVVAVIDVLLLIELNGYRVFGRRRGKS